MGKQSWKPGNMLYPVPAVLVTVADRAGKPNIFTVAWTGTVCSDPPMVSISVRPERYSACRKPGKLRMQGDGYLTSRDARYVSCTGGCGTCG